MKQHGENKSCYRETLLSSQHTHILAYLSYYSGRSILTPTDGQLLCSDGKESTCNAGDLGLIPGSGRTPGEGNGNPLQYSCLENPMDRGAWWATVHWVAKSQMTERLTLSLTFYFVLDPILFYFFKNFTFSVPFPYHFPWIIFISNLHIKKYKTKLCWLYSSIQQLPYFWLQFPK